MGTSAADMHKLFGSSVLFIFRTENWALSTFKGAAQFARSLGFDTISPKRAEGTQRWYDTPQTLKAERAAVLAEGVGYAPFIYCDGPKFGDGFIPEECAVVREMGDANDGIVIADMESEWNGNPTAGEIFEQQMRPWPGVLGVTTWADPAIQDWLGVAAAIAPCVNLWIPQRYDDWLAAQPLPSEETIVQPGIDMSGEFGANDPLGIARRIAAAGQSGWVWEYVFAQQNPSLARAICQALHAQGAIMAVSGETALPAPGFDAAYVTGPDDHSLAELAVRLGLSNPDQQLYKPNLDAIEAAVRAAGYPAGSGQGAQLVPGIHLNYNVR